MEVGTTESAYTISQDHREVLEQRILAELNRDLVVKTIKSALDSFCQSAIDQTTDYLKDEYALVLEDVVRERADRVVIELLKGNEKVAEHFNLTSHIAQFGFDAGKEYAYDSDGIRKSILERFKDSIIHAELIALRSENESLRTALRVERERRY